MSTTKNVTLCWHVNVSLSQFIDNLLIDIINVNIVSNKREFRLVKDQELVEFS
jgi:hypothetical protein